MARPRREKQQIKPPGQALALSQEILAGLRRNSHQQVSMDEDSMENIDAYWNMANKELEEMERKQYEDISMLDSLQSILHTSTPEKSPVIETEEEKRPCTTAPAQPPRRSFDEEFQDSLQNVVLTGFSDSDEEILPKGKETKDSATNTLPTEEAAAEISPTKKIHEYSRAIDEGIELSNISVDGDKSVCLGRKKRKYVRKSKTISPYKLLYKECAKTSTEILNFTAHGLNLQTIHIKAYSFKKIDSNCIYYITRGSVIVEDPSVSSDQAEEVFYKNKSFIGRRLKAGAVFNNTCPTVIYNPAQQVCTLVGFTNAI
ncbi:hypothetical protein NEPAR06_0371 [Nematocida parisii]|uniref:Uncharacterized protein n=1 Tax=Nematocida parisii (strain ERTm3) TaxID=935791 RepID=I3EG74_NEMP3|nr:uncharacterized protein NEPG_01284 [Nematocida parisii ERTm1]EIJ88221.1 hypothetical protein NEQG_01665 [Nematocida parisii ERTm3]KAI5125353.1 hypothetical protein NEPAR03_0028 [Nematocida parisii]EIJ93712.1 hypothetical protein NEPG_01284 [Nematocida parisii ERTm1]KAI5125477.1 hypothetical protein NEPAR08_0028 [Nematocida parisii]KAI5140641.1 hypothetical protein NEPAR04_0382 [Nematocida parisii]|eukprot:XP_013059112.1 hypothetical protein NEPG_01284 [Nematocida parisii ERTm1]